MDQRPRCRCCVIELDYQFSVFWLLLLFFVTYVITSVISPSVNLSHQVNDTFFFTKYSMYTTYTSKLITLKQNMVTITNIVNKKIKCSERVVNKNRVRS